MYDSYLPHLLDHTTGRRFHEMSTSERLASIGAPRQVVWDGQYVTAAAAERLANGAPKLGVSPAVPGLWAALQEANFGPTLPTRPLSGGLVVGSPIDGCSALATLSGPVALLYQGSCHPMDMAYRAQDAGALAVLIADDSAYTPPIASIQVPLEDVNALPITIPTVGISRADADLLQAAASGLTVTLEATTAERVGADPAGHVYMYASVPVADLSTLSHWDPLTRPNLVLEPTATRDYPHDIGFEQALLRDIGWEPLCGDGRVDPEEECDSGSANSDTQPDTCRTGCIRPKCGDQVVDTGEECDKGTANLSDTQPDACRKAELPRGQVRRPGHRHGRGVRRRPEQRQSRLVSSGLPRPVCGRQRRGSGRRERVAGGSSRAPGELQLPDRAHGPGQRMAGRRARGALRVPPAARQGWTKVAW